MTLYIPGESVLHRLPAGVKLCVFAAAAVLLSLCGNLTATVLASAAAIVLVRLASIPLASLIRQLRALALAAPLIFLSQTWLSGPVQALVVTGSLIATFALAAVVTATTRVAEIIESLERLLAPLKKIGFRPERTAVLLALALRCLPLIEQIVSEISQARLARNARGSMASLAGPAVIRALRTADSLAESLAARGFDD
jgi:biotin transport system permease protein